MPITLGANILYPAMRKAGITRLPGTTPSSDQSGELITACNRLLDSWNVDGHKIYKVANATFNLTSGQKVYTIGPGAELDVARPLHINFANMVFPTSPEINQDLAILDDISWAQLDITDLPGSLIWALYYDHGMDASGWGKVYIFGQPPANYKLQLWMWEALKTTFTATSDGFIFPPGYQKALVDNLALECEALYPRESLISADLRQQAQASLWALKLLNAKLPRLLNEAANLGSTGDQQFPWWYWQSH